MLRRELFGRGAAAVLLCVAVAFLAGACKSTGEVIPEPQALPAGQSFSGVWYSQQFEHMHLTQTGDRVAGIFTYDAGGTIEGEVDGNLLRFKWVEPGDKSAAQRTQSGQGYFQLVVDAGQAKLRGEWGYDEARVGGGPWTAEYIRPLDPEDPLTLEALRD